MSNTQLARAILAELTGNILPFWRQRVCDGADGFIAEMDAGGNLVLDASHGLILNARLLWSFAAFYRWTHAPEDRELAQRALSGLMNHFHDDRYGGFVWTITADRQVEQCDKKIYGQAFCVYALTEYFLATTDTAAKEAAITLFRLIEQHAHDSRYGGYFEVCQANWERAGEQRLSEVDQAAPKSMNTQLHVLEAYTNLARVWSDPLLTQRLAELVRLFSHRVFDAETNHLHHFFERDWRVCSHEYTYGHDIEASWLLCEAADVLDQPNVTKKTVKMARRLARATIDEGLGADGGLYNEGRDGRPTDRSKIWWVQAEAVVGLLNMHTISQDQQYLRAADQVWQYICQHVVDRQQGEWHWRLDPQNRPAMDLPKVSIWKGPYHNGRMCLEVLRRHHDDNSRAGAEHH